MNTVKYKHKVLEVLSFRDFEFHYINSQNRIKKINLLWFYPLHFT